MSSGAMAVSAGCKMDAAAVLAGSWLGSKARPPRPPRLRLAARTRVFCRCLRSALTLPGVRSDSGTHSPESDRHLAVVSRFGVTSGNTPMRTDVTAFPEETKHVDERHRGSPVGSRLPGTRWQTHLNHWHNKRLRDRHRARLCRPQDEHRSAIRRAERKHASYRRNCRANRR